MRKLVLFAFTLLVTTAVFAQQARVKVPQSMKNIAVQKMAAIDETTNLQTTVNPYVHSRIIPFEAEIGGTIYDLQSNASSPSNRLQMFGDGTIGATWTRGTGPTAYADRGTGYNYFNGTSWGPAPTNRVETARAGWPAYCACGPNGEAFVSHVSGTAGLNFVKRDTKGTGAWTETVIAPPAGASGLLWPRMVASGPDNMYLHVFALTAPTGNGGTVYNNQDGAVVYTRSMDGGATWTTPEVLEGMGADYYVKFGGDSYSLSANGDNVAFLLTDNWTDMFAMKSNDNGETWEKIVIWEHPIPMWNNTPSVDTIYCPDGAGHAAFDNNNKLHVVFGINRAFYDTQGSWFPFVDGLAYWNEDMETFTGGDQVNILNPDNVFEMGNLLGYMLDLNENGALDFICFETACIGNYELSPTSMPQIVIGEYNQIAVVFASTTEGYDNGSQQYKHLWGRFSPDGGTTWGDFIHLSEDILHILDECVFPSVANVLDGETVRLIYQADSEPGLAVRGDEDTPGENVIYYMEATFPVGVNEHEAKVKEMVVSQNYPNPFNGTTAVNVTLAGNSEVSVDVYSITGQKVTSKSYGHMSEGTHRIELNSAGLNTGIYFYTVKAGEKSSTGKMTVL
ncbi:MAG: T9SS type A sorting domain-containing protein [Bacteroidales bacterium]|nr:T9SS type A sorting domain-containing protein [Bacteroidales bacterium]